MPVRRRVAFMKSTSLCHLNCELWDRAFLNVSCDLRSHGVMLWVCGHWPLLPGVEVCTTRGISELPSFPPGYSTQRDSQGSQRACPLWKTTDSFDCVIGNRSEPLGMLGQKILASANAIEMSS